MAIVWKRPAWVLQDPLNLLLTTLAGAVAAAPFVPVDWPVTLRRAAPELVDPPNLLTAELSRPFGQNDWPAPKWGGYVRAIDPPNLAPGNLTQPFVLTDWPTPRWTGYVRALDPPNRTAEIAAPFVWCDWPSPAWRTRVVTAWTTTSPDVIPEAAAVAAFTLTVSVTGTIASSARVTGEITSAVTVEKIAVTAATLGAGDVPS